jgi:hypothetical protein
VKDRFWVLQLAGMLALAVYSFCLGYLCSGCAGLLPTPPTPSEDDAAPARFVHVGGNLWRSAQPTASSRW